jgi:hypothetical protein
MDNKQAYSVTAFCQLNSISRALYYKMRAEGKAPTEIRVGRRVLISQEAAAEWRRRMETETAA